jgi:hypothetical protein
MVTKTAITAGTMKTMQQQATTAIKRATMLMVTAMIKGANGNHGNQVKRRVNHGNKGVNHGKSYNRRGDWRSKSSGKSW